MAKKKLEKPKSAPVAPGAPRPPVRASGPTKSQVCDAIRREMPGLPFAAVERIASAMIRLFEP